MLAYLKNTLYFYLSTQYLCLCLCMIDNVADDVADMKVVKVIQDEVDENGSLPKMGTFEINKDLNSQKDPYSS